MGFHFFSLSLALLSQVPGDTVLSPGSLLPPSHVGGRLSLTLRSPDVHAGSRECSLDGLP